MPGFSNKFMGRDANHNPTFCDYLKKKSATVFLRSGNYRNHKILCMASNGIAIAAFCDCDY